MTFKFKNLTMATIGVALMFGACQKDAEIIKQESKETPTSEQEKNENSPNEKEEKTHLITMSVSDFHLLSLDNQGELFGLGKGERLGTEEEDVFPMKKIGNGKWVCVSAGYKGSLAIKDDGTMWATGGNNAGQLGNGTNTDIANWEQIGTDTDWKKVCLGYDHAIGLKKDGSIWGWGTNEYGQIAGNDDKPSNVPRKIGTDNDWVDISASNRQSFAIKKDGSAWSWGHNNFGLLGIGVSSGKIFTPTKIQSDKKWKVIVSGIKVTAGIKEDGSLWVWGRNYHGELGNGSGSLDNDHDSSLPTKVNDEIWKKVSVGADHLLAIRNDGTLWSWGQNMAGELGNMDKLGDKTIQNVPKQIGTDNDWIDITAGHFISFAKKANQKIFGWGRNRTEWLGNSENNQKTPIEVKF